MTSRIGFAFPVILLLLVASANGTEELAEKPPSLPLIAAEEVSADTVNLIFLFDRVATKSTTVVSPHYLDRIADPNSRFHRDYEEYRRGRIESLGETTKPERY